MFEHLKAVANIYERVFSSQQKLRSVVAFAVSEVGVGMNCMRERVKWQNVVSCLTNSMTCCRYELGVTSNYIKCTLGNRM